LIANVVLLASGPTSVGVFAVGIKVPKAIELASVELALIVLLVVLPLFVQFIVTVNGPTVNRVTLFPGGSAAASLTTPFVPIRLAAVR
jgi:hypothetical protein